MAPILRNRPHDALTGHAHSLESAEKVQSSRSEGTRSKRDALDLIRNRSSGASETKPSLEGSRAGHGLSYHLSARVQCACVSG